MSRRGVRLWFGILALAVASPAGAQGNLDQGKTAAQLYASACAPCHKSPQSVSKTKLFFGLETFLREHYTSSSESAAILAAYLKGQQKRSQMSQTKSSDTTVNEFGEQIPRPPADIPDPKR